MIGPGVARSRTVILAYDEVAAIKYFGKEYPPYWKRNGDTMDDLMNISRIEQQAIMAAIQKEDTVLRAQLTAAGGQRYADLSALIFRQSFGACNMIWNSDRATPWYMLKEISSCGCLQTVDVIYPMAPIVLYSNPMLLYRMLQPLLAYANNETNTPYNLPWAPHHLGSYPIADLPPDKQEQMPVEESGNILILFAAIAQRLGRTDFIEAHYWPLLETWAQYLKSNALDPGDQLCTDDFEGPRSALFVLRCLQGVYCNCVWGGGRLRVRSIAQCGCMR